MKSWSVSSVKGWHTCQLQTWFKRQGLKEEAVSLSLVEGIVLHEALAFHLKGLQSGEVPPEEEVVELLDAMLFDQEMRGEVAWGRKERGEVLLLLSNLYRHWRQVYSPKGEVFAVEQEVRVHLPEVCDLPLLGYADLVLRQKDGSLSVVDFKTTGSKPYGDDLFDPLDLQRLAMTRGIEAATGERVSSWAWVYLVKTKAPQVIEDPWEVTPEGRPSELAKLRAIVEPTIKQLTLVEEGALAPVPSQSYFAPCRSCGFRMRCAAYSGTNSLVSPDASVAKR